MSRLTDEQKLREPRPLLVTVESTAANVLGPFKWLISLLALVPYIGYRKAIRFERDLPYLRDGGEVLEWWSRELDLGVQVEGLENLPTSGPVVLYSNHPTGLTDGIALWDAIKSKRRDMKIMMNAQGLDQIDAFADLLVPVRLSGGGKSRGLRGTLSKFDDAMAKGALVTMFPAGRLSQLDWFGDWDVHEVPWQRGIVRMAKTHPEATFLPVFIEGRVRKHYYVLHRLFWFMRDVFLFTEFHSKRHWPYRVQIGQPIPITDPKSLQAHVEGMKRRKWFQLPRQKQ